VIGKTINDDNDEQCSAVLLVAASFKTSWRSFLLTYLLTK